MLSTDEQGLWELTKDAIRRPVVHAASCTCNSINGLNCRPAFFFILLPHSQSMKLQLSNMWAKFDTDQLVAVHPAHHLCEKPVWNEISRFLPMPRRPKRTKEIDIRCPSVAMSAIFLKLYTPPTDWTWCSWCWMGRADIAGIRLKGEIHLLGATWTQSHVDRDRVRPFNHHLDLWLGWCRLIMTSRVSVNWCTSLPKTCLQRM